MTAEFEVPSIRRIRSSLRIRHLELLLALDELRSLHKAGERMNMTQSAASKLLREIEVMFGVPLFLRSRRGITPTAFGTALFGKASLLLADLDGARDELDSLARGGVGRIRIGALQVALPVLVPQSLARLREEQPGITMMVQEGASDVLLTALAHGELDCVLGRMTRPVASDNFRWEVLYDEPVCVVARRGHPLARKRKITPECLARQAWILPPREAPLRQTIEHYFVAHRVELPKVGIESVSVLTNAVLIRDTDMIAAMPLTMAHLYEALDMLAILRFRPDWMLPPVGIAMRAGALESPAFASFLSTLRSVARELKSGMSS
ncbi:LysR family transcriptional regulator [Burkholderia cepacia]|uniref:LysR family transcriptional regulator n=1 Tax=Burkholderia cepacia TaxID=292 RepID=UPI00157AC219|nr:LysR family transcriptional regulator [Burkholderia cepacia]NTX43184.1 LysR family transcriptional regulator [Burkholderia cepacia]